MASEECIEKLETLLIRSEERIDRTNEMMCKCMSILDTVTKEYSAQIIKLQDSRDELMRQNAELIKLMQKYEGTAETIGKKYDALLERMLGMIPRTGTSENNITIK